MKLKIIGIEIFKHFTNVVLFIGFLTEWFFVFIALTIFIKRIIDGEIFFTKNIFCNNNIFPFLKESLKYWITPIFAVFCFLLE